MTATFPTSFAPMLFPGDGLAAITFYIKAFGALELQRWSNPDGTIHVAEMSVGGAIFHLRETSPASGHFSPGSVGGITSLIELWVEDPAAMSARAVAAGAKELKPVQDYAETGYRQGTIEDPFGYRWHIMRPLPTAR